MRRAGALAVAVLMVIVLGQLVLATPPPLTPILAAGNGSLAIIDANGNGIIGDPEDCVLNASGRATDGLLLITGKQADGPNKLRVCTGNCTGNAFLDGTSDEVVLHSCTFAGAPFVPMTADFCPKLGPCLASNINSTTSSAAVQAGLASVPLTITAGVVTQDLIGVRSGFGQVCTAGGPAVEITGDDGVKVLRALEPFPSSGSPTHMCVRNVPVQLASDGFVFRTACFPVENGVTNFALASDPEVTLARIDFTELPPCGAVRGAPTVSEWGLIVMMLGLLSAGVWTLSRRRAFYAGLPLP